MIKKLLLPLFLMANLFLASTVFGQVAGDYRSNAASGNWADTASWQYYNGTSWISATNYPGQVAGTGAVLIQTGNKITMISTPITIGTFTINGQLILLPNISHTINTTFLIVTSPSGSILFDKKSDLKLPSNTPIQVNTGGLLGDCSNNNSIFLGTVEVAVCAGGGNTVPTFDAVMASGGYNVVNISPSSDSSCGAKTFSFTATATPSSGATINWYTVSSGGTSIATGITYSSTISTTTTYYVEAFYGSGSSAYTTPRVAVVAAVNPLPDNTISTGFTGGSFCAGSQATLTFDADDTNGAPPYTLSYTDGTTTYSQNITTNAATTFNIPATTSTGYTLKSITNANGCVNLSPSNKTANVTFRPNPTATISGTTAVCLGATSPNITFTNPQAAGIIINYTINGGANRTVAVAANSTTNVTVPTTTTGSFVYALVSVVYSTNPSCTQTLTDSATVTINATPTAPTIGTTTQPDCTISTGSVVLSGLPASGTIDQTGTATNSYPITGSTMTISGLSAGTYNFTASSGTCTSSPSVNVDINTSVPNTWDGTVWSAGTPNTNAFSNQALVFNGNYPSSTDDLFGCSCTVNSGFNVVIGSGRTMTITNGVTVSGTLTFNNDASLVQKNDADTNTGDITYNRMTTAILSTDYTYWSSPVAGYTLGGVSQNTAFSNMYYSYNSTSDDWEIASAATLMAAGNGYIIGGPKTYSAPSTYQASFTGIPNNGVINASIGAANTSNLLGNPYPSALNADKFLAANSGVLDGTIYFWTHNTAIQLATNITNGTAGSGTYAYTSDDYASYNSTGGVGTGTGSISTGLNVAIPNGNIASGEGFFTTSVAAGNAVFNNSMRVDNFDNTLINSQFFKTSKTKSKSTNAVEKNRIWLDLSNSQGAFKQTLVGYVTGATNEYDTVFDGESFDGNEFVDFYSVNQDRNLVIQGRALPFDETDEVPLGYRTAIDGAFTINIDQADGLLADQAIFIEDKLTNTVFDLKSGDYTFATTSGVFNDRFVLRYTNNNNNNNNKTLGTNKFVSKENQVLVSSKNKQITINSSIETIDKVTIYDLLGRQIYQKTKVDSNELSISNLVSSHQTLVVKTILQNGTTVSDKIIF